MLFDIVGQPTEVGGDAQKVIRLAPFFGRALVVATESIFDVAVRQKSLASHTVETLVFLEVDLARVVDLLQDLLNDALVVRIGGADESIEREPELFPGGAERAAEYLSAICCGDTPCCAAISAILSPCSSVPVRKKVSSPASRW